MNALQANLELADVGQASPVGRSGRPRVVIVGAGFGGLMAAKALAGARVDVMGENGKPVPGVAPTAKQQGAYVAKVIRGMPAGRRPSEPFRYFNAGNLAAIGRRSAVADFGWVEVSGFPAWLLWGIGYIFFLIGFRNRVSILIEWIWAYITFQRGACLITGPQP